MRNRRPILVVTVAVVLGAVVTLESLRRAAPAKTVTVLFRGYTTDDSGRRMAVFSVANQSRVTMVCPDSADVQLDTSLRLWSRRVFDFWLRPGDSTRILVEAPQEQGRWRLRIGVYREDWRFQLKTRLAEAGKALHAQQLVPRWLRSIREKSVWSEWITP